MISRTSTEARSRAKRSDALRAVEPDRELRSPTNEDLAALGQCVRTCRSLWNAGHSDSPLRMSAAAGYWTRSISYTATRRYSSMLNQWTANRSTNRSSLSSPTCRLIAQTNSSTTSCKFGVRSYEDDKLVMGTLYEGNEGPAINRRFDVYIAGAISVDQASGDQRLEVLPRRRGVAQALGAALRRVWRPGSCQRTTPITVAGAGRIGLGSLGLLPAVVGDHSARQLGDPFGISVIAHASHDGTRHPSRISGPVGADRLRSVRAVSGLRDGDQADDHVGLHARLLANDRL